MENNYRQYEIKEGICFLIDLTRDIFVPLELLNFHSQFEEILSAINELVKDLVITLPSTGIGIYLYNCEDTDQEFKDGTGLRSVFRLNDINSVNMKKLHDLLEDHSLGLNKLQDIFKYAETTKETLPYVLNTMLSEINLKTHYNNRKMIWITNKDNPYEDIKTQRRLWRIINDYDEYKININPLFLDSYDGVKKRPFLLKKFERIFLNTNILHNGDDIESSDLTQLVSTSNKIKVEAELEPKSEPIDGHDNMYNRINRGRLVKGQESLFTSIRAIILRLKEIKRVQFSCNLILSDGNGVGGNLGCSVKGYTIYNHEKPRRYENLYNLGELLKLVHVRTENINERDGLKIPKVLEEVSEDPEVEGQLERGYDIGGEILYLREKEMNFLKGYTFDHTPEQAVGDKSSSDIDKAIDDGIGDEIEDVTKDTRIDVTFSKTPYLKLIGFRELNQFQPHYITSNAVFVTADLNDGLKTQSLEGGYLNSFTTFSSLYQGCVKLKRYAIVFGCTKRNSIPALYALYPTRVQNSSKNSFVKHQFHDFPQGFFLLRLPWLDDIRSLPEYALRSLLGKMEDSEPYIELVEKLKFVLSEFGLSTYQPVEFPNPQLNYFYQVLRMNFLEVEVDDEEDELDEFTLITKKLKDNDYTFRKLMELRGYLLEPHKMTKEPRGSLIQDINHHLNKISNESIDKKRPHEDKLTTNVKREKKEIVELTDEDILTSWKNNLWGHLTVAQLREFISKYSNKIEKATRKGDMIANISEYLEKKYRENGKD